MVHPGWHGRAVQSQRLLDCAPAIEALKEASGSLDHPRISPPFVLQITAADRPSHIRAGPRPQRTT